MIIMILILSILCSFVIDPALFFESDRIYHVLVSLAIYATFYGFFRSARRPLLECLVTAIAMVMALGYIKEAMIDPGLGGYFDNLDMYANFVGAMVGASFFSPSPTPLKPL